LNYWFHFEYGEINEDLKFDKIIQKLEPGMIYTRYDNINKDQISFVWIPVLLMTNNQFIIRKIKERQTRIIK